MDHRAAEHVGPAPVYGQRRMETEVRVLIFCADAEVVRKVASGVILISSLEGGQGGGGILIVQYGCVHQ
jgi:hypothetical protein